MDQDHFLFVEKYRPRTIDECILPESIKNTFKGYVKQGRIPHLLVAGSAGGGKSTISKALCNEIGVDYIVINGSLDNGIDILRTKILSFASTISLTDAKKVVIIDEADYLNCVWEEEEVLTGTLDYPVPVPLKDLDKNTEIPLISFNMTTGTYENDIGWVVANSINDMYEVVLDNQASLCVTDDHPFIVIQNGNYVECTINDGLLGQHVVLFNQQPRTVVSVQWLGKRNFINLAVNKNQTFVMANGIVVHNCNSIQPALRNFMEEFSDNCTFILTCNYKDRIIAPLHSRCAVIDFHIPSNERVELAKQFFKRVLYILKQEHIEYDQKVVAELVQKHLPDYRRILNELQRYAASGKIDTGILINLGNESFKELFGFLQVKNFTETRKWVAKNADTNSDQIFRTLYDQGHNYIKKESLPQMILILADYSYKKAFVADQELNLMACLVEIMVAVEFL